jgi:uncharacterized membrane protein
MLFDSTLRKELARSFSATLVVILTIVLTMMLIRTVLFHRRMWCWCWVTTHWGSCR